jgi:hypothetical protein
MTETDPKLPVKERRLLAGLLKFTFFVIAFFAVMVTILFNMGGSSETLHQSLEKLISDSLGGRPTRVMKLNRVTFFPSVGADFEKLEIKETMASNELTVSAEKVRLFVSFWGFMSRRMGIKAAYLENVNIRKGVLGRNAFSIEKLFIDHDKGTQKALLRANGKLEEDPWTISMDLEVSGSVGGYTYHIAKNRNINLEIGNLRLKATLSEQISDYIKIEKLSLGMPEETLNGELSVSLLEGQLVKLGGRLTSGKTASIISPDLLITYGGKNINLEGKISSLQMDTSYMTGSEGPLALFNGLHEMLAYDLYIPEKKAETEKKKQDESKTRETERAFACRYDFNLKFVIDKTIGKDGKPSEGMEFDAVNKDGELTVTPVKGKVEPFKGACRDLELLAAARKE